MFSYPAVVVHGRAEAEAALRPGLAVTLLSARGAALHGGCLWWRAVIDAATSVYPSTSVTDILDCADAPGRAMAALRSGQLRLILDPACPAYAAVTAAAASLNAVVLPARPPALDLSTQGALRRLEPWLRGDTGQALG